MEDTENSIIWDKLKLKIFPVYVKQIIEIVTVEELNKVNQEVNDGSR